jgi:predicted esterase
MRARHPLLACAFIALASLVSHSASGETKARASGTTATTPTSAAPAPKPWCAPEVTELSDHVCYFDGGTPDDGRKTLVVYLHGALSESPGFAWLQQRAMALHAKRHHFTVLLPTSPKGEWGRVWPTSQQAMKDQEPQIVAGIKQAKASLEKELGHGFDEVFYVGFSSGAYSGSSAMVRGVFDDADGAMFLAGGSSWVPPNEAVPRTAFRAPIFVGVSAADPQTAGHSRAYGGTLAAIHWPYRIEERNAGHMVDWTFMAHGIAWLRAEHDKRDKRATPSLTREHGDRAALDTSIPVAAMP